MTVFILASLGTAMAMTAPSSLYPPVSYAGGAALVVLAVRLAWEQNRRRNLDREVTRRAKRSRVFRKAMHHE